MQSQVTESYEHRADGDHEHWWFQGRRRIFARLLQTWMPATPGSRVLDLGAGFGVHAAMLATHGRLTAVDLDADSLRASARRGAADLVRADATNPPLASSTFDLVAALDILEHLDDDTGALTAWRRVLKPGGRLLLSVPAHPLLWGRQDVLSEHRRRYRKSELRERLRDTGFALDRLSYCNSLLFPPIAATRLMMRPFLSDSPSRSDLDAPTPFGLNRLLAGIFALEARLLPHCNLPFGVSLVALARPVDDQA